MTKSNISTPYPQPTSSLIQSTPSTASSPWNHSSPPKGQLVSSPSLSSRLSQMLRLRHLTLPYLKKNMELHTPFTRQTKPNQTQTSLSTAGSVFRSPSPTVGDLESHARWPSWSVLGVCPLSLFRLGPSFTANATRFISVEPVLLLFIYYWFFVWVSYSRVLYLVLVSWTVSVSKLLGCATAYRVDVW